MEGGSNMKKKDNQYSVDYKEHGYTLFLNM